MPCSFSTRGRRKRAMDFVKNASFQPDEVELLSRFVFFPNQDRLFGNYIYNFVSPALHLLQPFTP